jgi:hypothetical protein
VDSIPNGNGEGRVVVIVFNISLWRLLKGLDRSSDFVLQDADPLIEYVLFNGSLLFAFLDGPSKADNKFASLSNCEGWVSCSSQSAPWQHGIDSARDDSEGIQCMKGSPW